MQYPSPTRCGACDAPAVFRFALCAPHELPATALHRRSVYRCPACFPLAKPDYVAGTRVDHVDWMLAVDPSFTRAMLDPRCPCGLPADHRNPMSGEPRPCTDETERIVFPGRGARPPVQRPTADVLNFVGGLVDTAYPPGSVTGDETGSGDDR